MDPIDVLAVAIIAVIPFDLAVTVFLFHLLRDHADLTTLRSRAYTQLVLLVCSTIGALFAVLRLTGFHLSSTAMTLLLALLILLPSAPGIYWVWAYRGNRLDGIE